MPPQYTESFRDPEVWDAVREVVGSSFLGSRVFRTWRAGCATGEEAFSLACMLQEIFAGKRVYWKVYATDIAISDKQSVKSETVDSYSLQLKAYSLHLNSNTSNIRFRRHDLVADPPLTFMNLIFCRNVLMFFKKEYQEIICRNLYNGLRTGGYLVLGKAEQIPRGLDKEFSVVDNKLKIYQKN